MEAVKPSKLINPTALDYADFELSEVSYSEEDPNIAYVYRKVYTVTGAEKYFKITLHKSKDDTYWVTKKQVHQLSLIKANIIRKKRGYFYESRYK